MPVQRGRGGDHVVQDPLDRVGVRLDHAAVARHPRTHAYLNLVQEGWELRGAFSS
jgi:hypothetical protein